MIVYIIKPNHLINFCIPPQKNGNYWLSDFDDNGEIENLINIEEIEGTWILTSNYDFDLYVKGQIIEKMKITPNSFCFLKNKITGETYPIFIANINQDLNYYTIVNKQEITIGNNPSCDIYYNNSMIGDIQTKISFSDNNMLVDNIGPQQAFINHFPISKASLKNGDILFIMGLKIIIIGNIILINNPANSVQINSSKFSPFTKEEYDLNEEVKDDEANVTVFKKNDYFNRSPRFKSSFETLKITVDSPPPKEKEDNTPMIITFGPMLTMGMTSIVMLYTGVNNAINSNSGINGALPSIVMSVAMIGTMIIWPFITRKYNDKRKIKLENKRKDKYSRYIQEKRQIIVANIAKQRQALLENYLTCEECSEIILNRKPKLWERKINEDDFLKVRLGTGNAPLDIDINYQEAKFSLDDDVLKSILQDLIDEAYEINGAPITVSLLDKQISAIIGKYNITKEFTKSLLLQLATYYSGDILKFVIFTSEQKANNWQDFKYIPHNFSNDKQVRYFATSYEECKSICQVLEKELSTREDIYSESDFKNESKSTVHQKFNEYYIIITDNYKMIYDQTFIKKVLKSEINYGFSVLVNDERISNLPNECTCFINVNDNVSGLIENDLVSNKQHQFIADFPNKVNIGACCQILANIPILYETKSKGLPDSYTLLEMYNIGKIEQLNSKNRWKNNDATISLAAPVGTNENGELFKLDLHEKFHGPHGLVAGTTGSGKSEFLITFILSMAINYSPEDVSFVIIDYKGGGLALAFENKERKIKLPHIAGTITNLDTNELNRALASIDAELKRRQKEFNIARDISGESTIDIYKYQKLYKQGIVKKPISHLFLISDEFAELKSQQPEFMDQLISTARIGRSLGVHLILATQKPAGVVNDQIWSNSRFKVCLKVQDKADSKDMIRVPDAAELKQAGRFYLLVGYNDFFALGQSAYCGSPYIPSEKIRKKVDTSLNFINNIGYSIKSIDALNIVDPNASQGEVLLNVVKYLSKIAQSEKLFSNQLWLDKIPAQIYVTDLVKKYNFQVEKNVLNPVIGQYDDPSTQSQHLLTLPLSKTGNLMLYGMTGSGKEDLLQTLILSISSFYSPKEVNMYIIDCGAETLKLFKDIPHVGDVALSNETDKVNSLFNLLNSFLNSRKKMFYETGGTIENYNKNNENPVPYILVILNGYENFSENYETLEDEINTISRDGLKYGIIFIISTTNPGTVKFKLRQNFAFNITLQLTDPYDYVNILGNTNKVIPSAIKGRGLVKFDKIYEFQTASLNNFPILETISKLSAELKNKYNYKAQSIPVLPSKITISKINTNNISLTNFPVGMIKKTLLDASVNLQQNYLNLFVVNDINRNVSIINGLVQATSFIHNVRIVILDPQKIIFSAIKERYNYYDLNFDNVIEKICLYLKALSKEFKDNNYSLDSISQYPDMLIIIPGLAELFDRLNNQECKTDFTQAIIEVKKTKKVAFLLIDTLNNFNNYNYEEWFKNNIKNNQGVWVGNGFADQSLIKPSKITGDMYKMLDPLFGYLVNDGQANLIKLIEYEELEVLDF